MNDNIGSIINEHVLANDGSFFYRQLRDHGLDTPQGWEGEYRDRFIGMLKPLLEGTDFYLEKNLRDVGNGNKRITNLCDNRSGKRKMGFEYMKTNAENKKISGFINKDLHAVLEKKTAFPERIQRQRTNPLYFHWSLIGLWNLLCVIGGKAKYTVNEGSLNNISESSAVNVVSHGKNLND